MTSPVKILAAGVDTLVLNVYTTNLACQIVDGKVSQELQEELTALKEAAQEQEKDIVTRFFFDGLPLLMTRKGEKGFQWILRNSKLALAVNRSSKMQLLAQARCSSEYLWSVRDLGRVVNDVHLALMQLFGEYIALQPSALDLAVDVVGLDLSRVEVIKQHFVSRAQLGGQMPLSADALIDGSDQVRSRWDRLTGFPFGSRAGAVSAVIYDKTHEIAYKSPQKKWFYGIWLAKVDEATGQPFWDGLSPVWRIEVRYKREALNEMKQERVIKGGEQDGTVETVFHGINDAYALEDHLAGLWSYMVGHVGGAADGLPDGWLRYVVPVADTNRSRWPVHPDWQVIQSAFQPAPLEESAYEREEREKEEYLRLVDEELAACPWKEVKLSRKQRRALAAAGPAQIVPVSGPVVELRPYVRQCKYQENMQRLVAQIAGTAITAAAWQAQSGKMSDREVAAPDLLKTFHFLYHEVGNYLVERGRVFGEEVVKRRVERSVERVRKARA